VRLGLALVLLAGCGSGRGRHTVEVVRDEVGREVRLGKSPATRVVSLAANVTEILFALDAGETLVGVDVYSDWPEAARHIPRVGNEYEPSVEKIVALRPDVVITATTANRRETADALERLGVPVYVTRVEGLASVSRGIVDLGRLVGREAQGRALAARLEAGLDEVRAHAARSPRVPALIVVWSEPLFVVGPGTYAADILAAAGGENIAADGGAGFPKYALELVLRRAPEVLVIGSHRADDPHRDPFAYWRRFSSLPAVRSGRLYTIDGDFLFRPGPRLVDGARALYDLLHPQPARVHAAH
jgi:iron complex transport system substrate-binding protein